MKTYIITKTHKDIFFAHCDGGLIGNRSTVKQAECRIREHAEGLGLAKWRVEYPNGHKETQKAKEVAS